jgi:hypothetical protein
MGTEQRHEYTVSVTIHHKTSVPTVKDKYDNVVTHGSTSAREILNCTTVTGTLVEAQRRATAMIDLIGDGDTK